MTQKWSTILVTEADRMRHEGNITPPRLYRELSCEVISNRPLAGSYWHLSVSMPSPAPTVLPGQFFQLLCPGQGSGNHLLRRPMSVYRIDGSHGRVEFLYKVVGVGTRALTSLTTGDSLNVFGPLGRGFWLEPDWRHVILLGRGAGLATLAPLAEAAIVRGMTNLIATCGSERLLRLAQRLGHELGIAGQVALEQPMACGIGMCFCCVRPFSVDGKTITRRICHEGPVFDVREALAYA
jgi:dihydroorotate dehydrogenase electron transfer subunit